MEKNTFENKEQFFYLFDAWVEKTIQTATLCASCFHIVCLFDHAHQARKNAIGGAFRAIPFETAPEKPFRDYFKESMEKKEFVPADLTFERIWEIPRRYLVARDEAFEIKEYLVNIRKNGWSGIIPPSFSWIVQTNKGVSMLFTEATLRFNPEAYARIILDYVTMTLEKDLVSASSTLTKIKNEEERDRAMIKAIDELKKKYGEEAWELIDLFDRQELLLNHPTESKKKGPGETLATFLKRKGLKIKKINKKKDRRVGKKKREYERQKTVQNMIKSQDVRREKEGNE